MQLKRKKPPREEGEVKLQFDYNNEHNTKYPTQLESIRLSK